MAKKKSGSENNAVASSVKSVRSLSAKEKNDSFIAVNRGRHSQNDKAQYFPVAARGGSAEGPVAFDAFVPNQHHFFPDPQTFEVLENQIIPKLFTGKPQGGEVRIWSLGCSTGEEAYSLAILLQEHIDALRQSYALQVFATDIDSRAITTARAGIYPSGIAADMSAERLIRFFSAESGDIAFRVNKNIRDMVIFSKQDVINDPPLSKLDLICCRNLFCSLSVDVHKKLIPLFHFALKPDGFLFLGTTETIEDYSDMFAVVDRKSKLYRRRKEKNNDRWAGFSRHLASLAVADGTRLQLVGRGLGTGKLSLRELTEQTLLKLTAPTGALVNAHGDILYLHGRTGMYLEQVASDDSTNNILKMAREGLRHELASALHKAMISGKIYRRTGLRVKSDGAFVTVNLTISPVVTGPVPIPAVPLYLIIMEEVALPNNDGWENSNGCAHTLESDDKACIASLRQEVRAKEEYLQAANEQLASANVEMQSLNEDLQVTNEELLTSKEELQSVNEEFSAINGELQIKVMDLQRSNGDLNNMLAGAGIATIFVDLEMRILSFTAEITKIVNLINGDVGRSLGHIVSQLVEQDCLVANVKIVMETQVQKEIDVQTMNGRWYSMRIHSYRTVDKSVAGAVITFIDTKGLKPAEGTITYKKIGRSGGKP